MHPLQIILFNRFTSRFYILLHLFINIITFNSSNQLIVINCGCLKSFVRSITQINQYLLLLVLNPFRDRANFHLPKMSDYFFTYLQLIQILHKFLKYGENYTVLKFRINIRSDDLKTTLINLFFNHEK